jgi:hypothetical protein
MTITFEFPSHHNSVEILKECLYSIVKPLELNHTNNIKFIIQDSILVEFNNLRMFELRLTDKDYLSGVFKPSIKITRPIIEINSINSDALMVTNELSINLDGKRRIFYNLLEKYFNELQPYYND